MTEQDIQADYTRKVIAARVGLAKALETRIANLKTERNRALESLREGENADAQRESEAETKPRQSRSSRNETSAEAPQGGPEHEDGPEAGLDGDQGPKQETEGAEEAEEPQE